MLVHHGARVVRRAPAPARRRPASVAAGWSIHRSVTDGLRPVTGRDTRRARRAHRRPRERSSGPRRVRFQTVASVNRRALRSAGRVSRRPHVTPSSTRSSSRRRTTRRWPRTPAFRRQSNRSPGRPSRYSFYRARPDPGRALRALGAVLDHRQLVSGVSGDDARPVDPDPGDGPGGDRLDAGYRSVPWYPPTRPPARSLAGRPGGDGTAHSNAVVSLVQFSTTTGGSLGERRTWGVGSVRSDPFVVSRPVHYFVSGTGVAGRWTRSRSPSGFSVVSPSSG